MSGNAEQRCKNERCKRRKVPQFGSKSLVQENPQPSLSSKWKLGSVLHRMFVDILKKPGMIRFPGLKKTLTFWFQPWVQSGANGFRPSIGILQLHVPQPAELLRLARQIDQDSLGPRGLGISFPAKKSYLFWFAKWSPRVFWERAF